MSRIIKSKLYKPFISLLVALILVFSFEVNKPKAIVPIVLWGAGILAGVIAEELLEMGIKHITADGKAKKKSKTKKIADEILDSLDGYDFDNTKPTRKADGSLEVNMSANDRAKIARKIADEFGDVIELDDERRSANSTPKYDVDVDSVDPMYNTSIHLIMDDMNGVVSHIKGNDMLTKLFNIKFTPVAFEGKTNIEFISAVDGSKFEKWYYGGNGSNPKKIYFAGDYYDDGTNQQFFVYTGEVDYDLSPIQKQGSYDYVQLQSPNATVVAYREYLKAMTIANTAIYYANGLAVPATMKKVYKVGDGYNGGALPNKQELSNKPYKIPNFFPPSSSDSDVEWEVVQNHYDNDVTTNQTKIDNEYETYLENGDLNQNTYNTQTINNYYTDTNYPIKSDDETLNLTINIDIDIPPPVVIDDDDDGTGTVPDGQSAPVIDRTLITYAKQTYDYLGDSIDGAIKSMRDITDDASGLVDYLDTSFRWLPAEWRALFGSAFILGVFAHFMRR